MRSGAPIPGRRAVEAWAGGGLPAGPGPYAPLGRVEVLAAVPPGSRRERRQGELLRAFGARLEAGGRRSHYLANLAEIWRVLVRRVSWADGTSMPVILCGTCRAGGDCREAGPHASWCLCRAAGVSLSTWKRARRWLESGGWLGTVRRGYKPGLMRPASLADPDEPCEAAVYVLCVPRQKTKPGRPADRSAAETGPLTRTALLTATSYGSSWAPQPRQRPPLPAGVGASVSVLRRGPFKTLSDRWCAWVARPFIAAGWLPADLGFAVEYDPSAGRHRGWLTQIAKPGPCLAWRLSRWLADPDAAWAHWRQHGRWPDQVSVLPSQSRRAWRDVTPAGHTYLARNRAKAAAAAAADPHPIAQALREKMGWAKPRRGES